jgi:hypothetical protein
MAWLIESKTTSPVIMGTIALILQIAEFYAEPRTGMRSDVNVPMQAPERQFSTRLLTNGNDQDGRAV